MSSSDNRQAPGRAPQARIAALGVVLLAAGLGMAGCGASQPSADVAEQPRLAEDRRAPREPAPGAYGGGGADPYAAAPAPRAMPVDGPAAYEPTGARAPAWPSAHREVMPAESMPLPPLAEPPPSAGRSGYEAGRPAYAGSPGSYAPPPPPPSHASVPPGWTVTPPPPAPYGAMPPRPADGYAPAAGGPVPAAPPAASAAGSTVVVQHGETVYRIASRHGVSVQSLMQANNLASPNIRGGQTLIIPPR